MRHAIALGRILAGVGFAADAAAEPLPRPTPEKQAVDEIIVVCKTHFDIGFTDLWESVLQMYRTSMIDRALDVVDASRKLPPEQRFEWTIPGYPMMKIMEDWTGQNAARKKRLKKAFEEDRLRLHALAGTLHTESLEAEDIVYALWHASELSRQSGKELPRAAKMTDVPSHSWILPTVLKRAGVEFVHLGCNPASASPEVPLLFWWEGPDGSRVLTMYSAGEYGTGLLPPDDWPYRVWLMMYMTPDNVGPPRENDVQHLFREAERKLPASTRVHMGRLEDFYDALMKTEPDIPVVRGDMPDTWIHGIGAMPIETGLARQYRPRLEALQVLATLNSVWTATAPPIDQIYLRSRENSLRFGEHTWGMDPKRTAQRLYNDDWRALLAVGAFDKLDVSYREKGASIWCLKDDVDVAMTAQLRALASSVDAGGERVLVYNPLPWARTAPVRLEVSNGRFYYEQDMETGNVAYWLGDPDSGKRIPVDRHTGYFVAPDLPASGYRVYRLLTENQKHTPSEIAADLERNRIENEFFRIAFEPQDGRIASIVEKETGREWIDSEAPHGFGQYLYERFCKTNTDAYLEDYDKIKVWWSLNDLGKPELPPAEQYPYVAATAENMRLKIVQGDQAVSGVLLRDASESVPHATSLTVTLYAGQPYIDLAWKIDNKRADSWPEAGWLCLPFSVDEPRFRMQRLGGIFDPAEDAVPNCNKDLYCLSDGMAVLGADNNGFGLCALNAPLTSLERPGLFKFSREFTPKRSWVYINLYNNQWGTNFQQWISGSWTSKVRLWSFENFDAEQDLATPSLEARFPAESFIAGEGSGDRPPSQPGLVLSRKGVAVGAFGANPDGDGILLRLWEKVGKGGSCEVTFPQNMRLRKATPCDLRGRPTGTPTPVKDNRIQVELAAFAPLSFLLD